MQCDSPSLHRPIRPGETRHEMSPLCLPESFFFAMFANEIIIPSNMATWSLIYRGRPGCGSTAIHASRRWRNAF